MSTTSTDPADIEADLERERADLATTLDALSDRVSVDNMARQALDSIKSHAGSYTSTIDHAVRANPIALALIGAGVAWMVLGNRVGGGSSSSDTSAMDRSGYDDLRSWEGTRAPEYGSVAYGSAGSSSSQDDDHGWFSGVSGLRSRASAALRRIESEARSYGAGARDFAAERASVISGFASDLRSRLSHGLEGLSDSSRDQVVAVRERAYAAGLKAERGSGGFARQTGNVMEDHPLVAGAVAFALGAAVAAALPRSETEDRAFGAERDRLMDEAARLVRSERERAMQVAGTLGTEIKSAAMETMEAVADTATQKAQEAARAVADTATQKAQEAASRVSDRATEEIGAASQQQSGQGRPDPVIS